MLELGFEVANSRLVLRARRQLLPVRLAARARLSLSLAEGSAQREFAILPLALPRLVRREPI